MKTSPVRHNAAKSRFEMDTPAGLAVADYRLEGDVMTIYHTQVPVPPRNRGYGYHLVRGTLEEVRRLNLKLVPQCWFVRQVIDRRPEFQDLLARRDRDMAELTVKRRKLIRALALLPVGTMLRPRPARHNRTSSNLPKEQKPNSWRTPDDCVARQRARAIRPTVQSLCGPVSS